MLSAKEFGYTVIRSYPKYDLCRCPYHDDRHPSALFFKADAKFRCLGCGKVVNHGDGKGYVGLEDEEEFAIVAAHINLFRSPKRYLESVNYELSDDLVDYMAARKIAKETLIHYDCLEGEKNDYTLLVMPQRTLDGKVIGTVNRFATFEAIPNRYFIDGNRVPAWPMAEFKPDGINFVSEGGIKAMALYQSLKEILPASELGNYSSIATMGSLWTKEIEEFYMQFPSQIYFLADNDKAGIKFGEKFKSIGARAFKLKTSFDDMSEDERIESAKRLLKRIDNYGFKRFEAIPKSVV